MEEKILQMQTSKQELADALYQQSTDVEAGEQSSAEKSAQISQQELVELLKPLQ